jgi:DNA polymerase-3 subunit gamma/tau
MENANFIVSARKYRPTTFVTVVGQQNITATLKNAIKTNHLAQAFLFCGPRGVGKTTCARILAKTINCFNITDNIEACNECESCRSFNEGHSLNVYELDAASNNSVDDIRNLIDQVRLAPQLGTHKVYIIDEVHMLSQAAFNAFLKTLEEPPKHAIFILATTEKHKIIPTILSRCQVFDFNRIQIEDIANHLKQIAEKEGIKAQDDALHIIAQKADGALRDALSIFDQIVSFSGNEITYENVIENLNILDYDYYFKITEELLQANVQQSLLIFNEILAKGFDGHLFLTGLAEHFRNLLVAKDAVTVQLLEVGVNIKEKYLKQAAKADLSFLINGLNILQDADVQYKQSKNPRLLVEVSLLKLNALQNASLTEGEKKNDLNTVFNHPLPTLIRRANTNSSKQHSANKENTSIKTGPQPRKTIENKQNKPGNEVKNIPVGGLFNSKTTSKTSLSRYTDDNKVKKENKLTEATKHQNEIIPIKKDEIISIIENFKNLNEENLILKALLSENIEVEKNLVKITYTSKAYTETINRYTQDILDYLRSETNNYSIQLNFILKEIKQEKIIYRDQDKVNKMIEENPNIKLLIEKLDLRPE